MGASTIDYVILRYDYMISKFKVLPKLIGSLSYKHDKIPYSQLKIERVKLCRNEHTP